MPSWCPWPCTQPRASFMLPACNSDQSGQPLLAIGMGLRGMVPCRALLSWVPVLAHATRAKVRATTPLGVQQA